jgi:ATP-binding cassette subfamily B (MDR/TAP) protein 1
MIALFFTPDTATMETKALEFLGYFMLMGFAAWCSVVARISIFNYMGEQLTMRLRSQTYEAILRQPITFFDLPKNSVGRLTARLVSDAALVKNANGEALGSIIEGLSAILFAVGIAFIASWQLALVMMGVFPFLIGSGYLQFRGFGDTTLADTKVFT